VSNFAEPNDHDGHVKETENDRLSKIGQIKAFESGTIRLKRYPVARAAPTIRSDHDGHEP
jgi:hypothetical protein